MYMKDCKCSGTWCASYTRFACMGRGGKWSMVGKLLITHYVVSISHHHSRLIYGCSINQIGLPACMLRSCCTGNVKGMSHV